MIKQNEELFDTLPCFKSELYLSSRDSLMACVPLFWEFLEKAKEKKPDLNL